MNESIGSVWPLAFTFFFIAVISGLLAFSVNYNKAFKMKDRVIYVLEKYDNKLSDAAKNEIDAYADTISYHASSVYTCNGYTKDTTRGWCYKIVPVNGTIKSGEPEYEATNGSNCKEYETSYINVVTFVSIDVPVFNRIFANLDAFKVYGSTKQITRLNDSC